jgi:hypothetical protein
VSSEPPGDPLQETNEVATRAKIVADSNGRMVAFWPAERPNEKANAKTQGSYQVGAVCTTCNSTTSLT